MSLFKSKTTTTATLYRAEPLGSPVIKKTKWNTNITYKTTIPSVTVGRKTRAMGTFFGGKPQVYFGGPIQIKKIKLPIKTLQKKFPYYDWKGNVDYSSAKDVKRVYGINLPHKYVKKAKLDLPRTMYRNIKGPILRRFTGGIRNPFFSSYWDSSMYRKTKDIIKHPVIKKAFKKVAKKVAVRTALAVSGVGTAAAVALTAHDIYSGSKWLYKKYKK